MSNMKNISKLTIKTPIGLLEITAVGDAVTGVKSVKQEEKFIGDDSSMKMAQKAKDELEEYFAGKRKVFDLPLRAEGTTFF